MKSPAYVILHLGGVIVRVTQVTLKCDICHRFCGYSGGLYFGVVCMMGTHPLLAILKSELAFLEQGGYRPGARYPWRPNFVFEDSPTCINFRDEAERRPCQECPLIEFVPQERRESHFPCRHIQLTESGETVNSFYEWGTEEELETALGEWLRHTIRELETGEKTHSPKAGDAQA